MKATEILKHQVGQKRADEVLDIFGKWMLGRIQHSVFGQAGKDKNIEGYDFKASATTDVDASAGFMVPVTIRAEVSRALGAYGKLLALTSQITAPAGSKIPIPEMITAPSAGVYKDECVTDNEVTQGLRDPGQTLVMKYIGGHFNISAELINNPHADVGGYLFTIMAEAVTQQKEDQIVNGLLATNGIANGLMNDSLIALGEDIDDGNTNAFSKFLNDAMRQNPGLTNTDRSLLLGPPHITQLMSDAGPGMQYSTVAGQFHRFQGHRVYAHGQTTALAFYYLFVLDPKNIVTATDGNIAIEFNEFSQFENNCIEVKVGQHFGFAIGNPESMRKAPIKQSVPDSSP